MCPFDTVTEFTELSNCVDILLLLVGPDVAVPDIDPPR